MAKIKGVSGPEEDGIVQEKNKFGLAGKKLPREVGNPTALPEAMQMHNTLRTEM
ncbi:hypothetical protein [Kalamiella sp. sgz302252]|uniref:hypothetical protein n=1 Tax=Pantoea sp. sgz302252 TaxID=3341827 RepID=UPI0036D39BF3